MDTAVVIFHLTVSKVVICRLFVDEANDGLRKCEKKSRKKEEKKKKKEEKKKKKEEKKKKKEERKKNKEQKKNNKNTKNSHNGEVDLEKLLRRGLIVKVLIIHS